MSYLGSSRIAVEKSGFSFTTEKCFCTVLFQSWRNPSLSLTDSGWLLRMTYGEVAVIVTHQVLSVDIFFSPSGCSLQQFAVCFTLIVVINHEINPACCHSVLCLHTVSDRYQYEYLYNTPWVICILFGSYRYSWSGTPLFIMAPPSNVNQMVPPCAHCGSPRVFEFQLMPALVSLLRSVHLSSGLSDEFCM